LSMGDMENQKYSQPRGGLSPYTRPHSSAVVK
jgi:hypothetical protein